jgi:hypothetical protein
MMVGVALLLVLLAWAEVLLWQLELPRLLQQLPRASPPARSEDKHQVNTTCLKA